MTTTMLTVPFYNEKCMTAWHKQPNSRGTKLYNRRKNSSAVITMHVCSNGLFLVFLIDCADCTDCCFQWKVRAFGQLHLRESAPQSFLERDPFPPSQRPEEPGRSWTSPPPQLGSDTEHTEEKWVEVTHVLVISLLKSQCHWGKKVRNF